VVGEKEEVVEGVRCAVRREKAMLTLLVISTVGNGL
jgi:hypothetical protein